MGLGKLLLKGGETVGGVSKRKHKKKKKAAEEPSLAAATKDQASPSAAADASKSSEQAAGTEPTKFEYEKEFKFETERMKESKARSTAWGATYRAPPKILHGYDRQVQGVTYEERLDLRCAKKADRMCK
jgi:hypothetical protein